jgi:methionyl-tRNA formyltransferase
VKIVFFGTPTFAASILKRLHQEGFSIPLAVTRVDKPRGRSQAPLPTEVKAMAQSLGIPVAQPEKASSPEFAKALADLEADLFVVVAYGEILKDSILSLPKLACINVHASLLPKYRGASPIQQAILEGEKESGITIMHMTKRMDAGNIIAEKALSIGENETAGELEERLCALGAELLINVLCNPAGIPKGVEQDEQKATYVKKILPEDAKLDFSQSAQEVHNKIRAMSPKPGAYVELMHKGSLQRVKIFRSRLAKEALPYKQVQIEAQRFLIGCGDGRAIEIVELQRPGKKRVSFDVFMRGLQGHSFSFP